MMELLFASTNPGKLRELRRMVEGLPVRVIAPDDLASPLPEVVEDGNTFEANAAKKAIACARASGRHALADDSGLCVDVLYGLPGVRSARWSDGEPVNASPACALGEAGAGEMGSEMSRAVRDEANNDKLLRALDGVEDELRGAEYKAVLVLARPDGSVAATVTGVCRGRVGHERRGKNGFGYDPLIIPEAELGRTKPRTMAELTDEEKDAISHRGEAFRKVRSIIEKLAATL